MGRVFVTSTWPWQICCCVACCPTACRNGATRATARWRPPWHSVMVAAEAQLLSSTVSGSASRKNSAETG